MKSDFFSVSVIVTVYNGEKYISECIQSILAQTLGNTEIICVDDASTDRTPEILLRYQSKVNILTNGENCGAGESRNRGLRIARGEYVIFLDADDLFEPCMLERIYYKAKCGGVDICIFREDLFTEEVAKRSNYPYAEVQMERLGRRDFFLPNELQDTLFLLWNGWAWDKLFRREYILDAGIEFPDIQTSEDGFFVHAALVSAGRISMLNEVLVHHRTGNSGSLSNTRDFAWESCLIYLKILKQYLEEKNLFAFYQRSYINWTASFLYWNYCTLSEDSRECLVKSMLFFFRWELDMGRYEKAYFYDAFLWWFAQKIMKNKEEQIPLIEQEHYEKVYQLNTGKLDELYVFMKRYRWKIALWGAGVRGQAFAKIYGGRWEALRIAYDMNSEKQGQKLCNDILIRGYDKERKDDVDCIIVLNSAHLLSVKEAVKDASLSVFDMDTYLTMPYGIGDCIIYSETEEAG